MSERATTPGRLAGWLVVYFGAVLAVLLSVAAIYPQLLPYFPIGGTSDILLPGQRPEETLSGGIDPMVMEERLKASVIVINYLFGTIILMLPVTWVYMAMKKSQGYQQAFIRTLVVMPICVTAIVLLIQDSLPLAFGLAALVAAVRFRVNLKDALDAVCVFCAICVGLASGVGYAGVAFVMTAFFCFAMIALWHTDYGGNPIERQKRDAKTAKQR